MPKKVRSAIDLCIRTVELLLCAIVLVCVVRFTAGTVLLLWNFDWQQTDTLYDLIYRVLLSLIGLELVRMIITHELSAILELIAAVIARKMLKPDLDAQDIAICALAFVAILGGQWILIRVKNATPEPSTPDAPRRNFP